jgi:hypothetical protein
MDRGHQMRKVFLKGLFILSGIVLSGCAAEAIPSSGGAGYLLTVFINQPAVSTADKTVYYKLVAPGGGSSSTPLYISSAAFPNSSAGASIYISGITAGSYDAYAFIDMNGDAYASDPLYGPGDYTTYNALTVNTDYYYTILSSAWILN